MLVASTPPFVSPPPAGPASLAGLAQDALGAVLGGQAPGPAALGALRHAAEQEARALLRLPDGSGQVAVPDGPVPGAGTPSAPTPGSQATSTASQSLRTYPPRTDDARIACQHVVDTMAKLGITRRSRNVVSVFTHADRTVSVGISGGDSPEYTQMATNVEAALNAGLNPPLYRVAKQTMPTGGVPGVLRPIQQQAGGASPGACAEPHAAEAAHGHQSEITGMDTRWRGVKTNQHPFTGRNADGADPEDSQMDPCATCADAGNVDTYMTHADT